MERALGDLIATLRRDGLVISTGESIDAMRAVSQLGVQSREDLRRVLATTLVKSFRDAATFEKTFERFFAADGETTPDWYEKLRARGFTPDEISAVRDAVEAQAAAQHGAPLYKALSEGGGRKLDELVHVAAQSAGFGADADPERAGYYTMRMLDAARMTRAEAQLAQARSQLRDAFGEARGDELADAIADELREFRGKARQHVQKALEAPRDETLERVPFSDLDPEETRRIERAVVELSRRMLGRAAMEQRRARRGRLMAGPTLRMALRSSGVPFQPRFRGRTPKKAHVVLLCDVSDSVRANVRFMLLFLHAAQRAFGSARSFVFVSDVREATEVFREQPLDRALDLACNGGLVNVADNSAYGEVFRRFLLLHEGALDQRATLIIIGDGRSNHGDPGVEALGRLQRRVARVVWLVPEPRDAWASGDSALLAYRKHAHEMLPMTHLASLREAIRVLARR
jgi:uncharacterized protein